MPKAEPTVPLSPAKAEAQSNAPVWPPPPESGIRGGQAAKGQTPKARPLPASFKIPVPPILLEGDRPLASAKSGPGEKFAIAPSAPSPEGARAYQAPPPVFGTGTLNAIARDPYCLFVSWDFSDEQQRYYNSVSADKHLVAQARYESPAGPIAAESHLSPDARHCFLHVSEAARTYYATLGYYLRDGSWIGLRSFGPVTTQPDRAAQSEPVQFGSVAPVVSRTPSAPDLPARSGGIESPGHWTAAAVGPSRSMTAAAVAGPETLHKPVIRGVMPQPAPSWTDDQERALAVIIRSLIKREGLPGSIELLEMVQRELVKQPMLSLAELGLLLPSSAEAIPHLKGIPVEAGELPSSLPPVPEAPARKGFWFNVNAELIIYGATEPDAEVSIGGRRIRLRPDGTFSYRFALPDGVYELPAQATSAEGSDSRRAELHFSRATSYSGEVGAHAQDKSLRVPAPGNLA